ncbi:MAG: dihydrodipicolinate synthase family protein [Pirellulales bacterium]|nr:dihydrodipicolinate synthase family protein [Pirellulales bacterium]
MQTTTHKRRALIRRLFPEGVPKLWCPPLTHYDAEGHLDRRRIAGHWQGMAPYVGGMLIPGSTGDGWEMDAAEQRRLLELTLEVASPLRIHVLAGALRTDAEEERKTVEETLGWLRGRTGIDDTIGALAAAGVCGFTVCPPAGADRSQREIHDRLAAILDLGAPTAIYQLPQVTQNEADPQTVAELAARYPNFYLFKDTSGADRVAASGLDFGGVYLVRGAEGNYGRWLQSAGGPYAGFLLSTANCFARQLHQMIEHIEQGDLARARTLIGRVEEVVARVFDLVAELPDGNAFTNANKAIDHFLAHGPGAGDVAPPRLHAGGRLPGEVIDATGRALHESGLMPETGYLAAC